MANSKQVVPWFNKQEWEEVYKCAYSMDPVFQKKAYEQMVLWRSRVSNLSMGVECTQTFLHIRICEAKRKTDGNLTFEDIDLKLIYSTAIMRFLNHLQNLITAKKTLYQLASMYNIPDWIVNLRHETAHGSQLPSLLLLRDAADYIYVWLNKNYWEKELLCMQDVIIEPETSRILDKASVETFMEKSLEVWKCVKLYQLGDYKNSHCVCREELCDAISELQNMLDPQIKKFTLKKIFVNTARHIQKLIFKKMLNDKDCIEKDYVGKCLVSQLILNPSFLPPANLHKKFINPFMIVLLNIWEEVIIEIQKHGLLLHLIRVLLDVSNDLSDPRQYIAAYWIRHIFNSLCFKKISGYDCSKVNSAVIHRVLEQLPELLNNSLSPPNFEDKIKVAFQKFRVSLNLQPLSYMGKNNMQEFVREMILTPSENTLLFLRALLNLCQPPLDSNTKHELHNLLKLYTNKTHPLSDEEDYETDILTLESLKEYSEKKTDNYIFTSSENEEVKTEEEYETLSVNCPEGNWSVYSGEEDWSKCAIGRTPWQKGNIFVTSMLEE